MRILGLAVALLLAAAAVALPLVFERQGEAPARDRARGPTPVDRVAAERSAETVPVLPAGSSGAPRSPRRTVGSGGPELEVRGRVELQPGGWPRSLEGVELRLESLRDRETPPVPVAVADGRWTAQLAPGDRRVAAILDGERLDVEPASVSVPGDAGTPIRLVVLALPAVRGRLSDCAGSPLGGVSVGVADRVARDRTAPDGTFAVPAPGGRRYELVVDEETLPPGLAPPWWQTSPRCGHAERPPRPSAIGNEHRLEAAVGGEIGDVVLSPAHRLRGTAIGPDGDVARGATLGIRTRPELAAPARGANYVLSTDGSGAFELELRAGTYEARYFSPARGSSGAWPDPVLFDVDCHGHEKPLLLVFDEGLGDRTITGTAVDSSGRPVEGASFMALAVQPGLTFETHHLFHASGWQSSDARGRLAIERLAARTYMVTRFGATDPDLLLVDAREPVVVDLSDGDGEFVWTVDACVPGRIEGTVSLERIADRLSPEVRVSAVRLRIDGWTDEPFEWLDRDGAFVFERVLPGRGRVELVTWEEAESRPVASFPVAVAEGQTVRLELP